MKIGVCIADYDIRNDLPDLLHCLARQHDIVVLATPIELPRVGDGPWEKRPVQIRQGCWNRLCLKLFNLFGRVPASKDNFLQNGIFLLQKLDPAKRRQATARLRFRLKLPPIFSFDLLLRLLRGSVAKIDDLDAVLFITNVASPELMAQALRLGLPCSAYVYSWDHAPKYDRFSCRLQKYFTWNAGIAEDLVSLQDVARSNTQPVGATQLFFILDYLRTPASRVRKIPFRYVYYGCAIAVAGLVEQEVRLVEWLAGELALVDPGIKLIVRPYPMLRDTTSFRRLRTRSNVVFDDEYREEIQERVIPRADAFSKLNLQEHAELFFHCGTTMGLEGAYFDTPLFFLAPMDLDYGVPSGSDLHVGQFFHTYHNQKHLMLPGFPNVVNRIADLRPRLHAALADRGTYLNYNQAIRRATPLRSLDEIAGDIALALQK
jgi:hypothetical protein